MIVYGKYRTGWRRLGAGILDALLLWLITWPLYRVLGKGSGDYLFWINDPIDIVFVVGLTYLFGATVGKKALGLKVLDARTEGRISLRQSILRHIGMIALFLAQLGMVLSDSKIRGGSWLDDEALASQAVDLSAFVWFLLELVTMLFNEKRRALHDFIAGTVVVMERERLLEISLNHESKRD